MKKLVALAAVGFVAAGCGEPSASSKPSSDPTERRADAVVACGLAMLEAERQGQVSAGSQLQVPWRVYEVPNEKKGVRRVSCAAVDDRGELGVIVDIACTDVNDASCQRLVQVARP